MTESENKLCYGCIYGDIIHTCLPKTYLYRSRSEFNSVEDWLAQNVNVEQKSDQFTDKRELIKQRLAELRK